MTTVLRVLRCVFGHDWLPIPHHDPDCPTTLAGYNCYTPMRCQRCGKVD